MLSKAEIQYLQGQKQVSKSYERKLKCLIRKKLEVLQKELPLLSRLLAGKVIMSLTPCDQMREAAPQSNTNDQEYHDHKVETVDSSFKCATKFSNLQFNRPESDPCKKVKSLNLDGGSSSVKDESTHATEFGNVLRDDTMKNSNADEIHNIELNPINISLDRPAEYKNLNISD